MTTREKYKIFKIICKDPVLYYYRQCDLAEFKTIMNKSDS